MLTKAQAKYIQNVGHKKFRDDENVFVAEGPKLVQELLQSNNVQLHSLYAEHAFLENHADLTNIIEVNSAELERISFLKTPNQVLGLFHKPVFQNKISFKKKITLLLDCIQDPGNLGSIMRIADWFAVEQIICSLDSADIYNPKVVQATMGSISRVRVEYIEPDDLLQNMEVPIYVTAMEGRSVYDMKKNSEAILVIGNESRGVRDSIMKKANEKLTIPKKGKAESLNAAVATGIILSHLL